ANRSKSILPLRSSPYSIRLPPSLSTGIIKARAPIGTCAPSRDQSQRLTRLSCASCGQHEITVSLVSSALLKKDSLKERFVTLISSSLNSRLSLLSSQLFLLMKWPRLYNSSPSTWINRPLLATLPATRNSSINTSCGVVQARNSARKDRIADN